MAFLKDILGAGDGAHNSILVTERGENLPIVNIAIDDITLIGFPSVKRVLKVPLESVACHAVAVLFHCNFLEAVTLPEASTTSSLSP